MYSEIYKRNQVAMCYVEQKIAEFGQSVKLSDYKQIFQSIENVLKLAPVKLIEIDTLNIMIDVQTEVNNAIRPLLTKKRRKNINQAYIQKSERLTELLAELSIAANGNTG